MRKKNNKSCFSLNILIIFLKEKVELFRSRPPDSHEKKNCMFANLLNTIYLWANFSNVELAAPQFPIQHPHKTHIATKPTNYKVAAININKKFVFSIFFISNYQEIP